MIKDTNYFGIGISKDVFDVMDQKGVHHQFKNDYSDYKKILKLLKQVFAVTKARIPYDENDRSILVNN